MSDTAKQRLIPVACVILGGLTAVVTGAILQRPEREAEQQVLSAFNQLPPQEQQLIMGKAAALQDRWDADPSEYERQQEL